MMQDILEACPDMEYVTSAKSEDILIVIKALPTSPHVKAAKNYLVSLAY